MIAPAVPFTRLCRGWRATQRVRFRDGGPDDGLNTPIGSKKQKPQVNQLLGVSIWRESVGRMIVGNAAFMRVSGRFGLLDAPGESPSKVALACALAHGLRLLTSRRGPGARCARTGSTE